MATFLCQMVMVSPSCPRGNLEKTISLEISPIWGQAPVDALWTLISIYRRPDTYLQCGHFSLLTIFLSPYLSNKPSWLFSILEGRGGRCLIFIYLRFIYCVFVQGHEAAHSSKMLHKGALEHLNRAKICLQEGEDRAGAGGSDSGVNSYSWAIIRALSFLTVAGRKGWIWLSLKRTCPISVALSLILRTPI